MGKLVYLDYSQPSTGVNFQVKKKKKKYPEEAEMLLKNRTLETLTPQIQRKKKEVLNIVPLPVKKNEGSISQTGKRAEQVDKFEARMFGEKKFKKKKRKEERDDVEVGGYVLTKDDQAIPKKKKKELQRDDSDRERDMGTMEEQAILKKKKKKKKHDGDGERDMRMMEEEAIPKKKKEEEAERDEREGDVGTMEEQSTPMKKKKRKNSIRDNIEEVLISPLKEETSPKHHRSNKRFADTFPQTGTPKTKKIKVGQEAETMKSPLLKGTPERVKKTKTNGINYPQAQISTHQTEIKQKIIQNSPLEPEDDYAWTREDQLQLLENIKGQLPSKDKKKSCRASLKKLDWESVAVEGRTPEECQQQINEVLSKLQLYKSLRIVVEEAKEYIVNVDYDVLRRRAIPMAHIRFMKDYLSPKRRSRIKAKGESKNTLKIVAEAWKALDKTMKQRYIQDYQDDLAQFKSSKSKKILKPFQIWAEEQKKVSYSQDQKSAIMRKAFNKLPDHTKIPFIKASLEQCWYQEQNGEEREMEEETAESSNKRKITLGPSKEELKLFLSHQAMPALPPSRVTSLYYQVLADVGKLDHLTTPKEKLSFAMSEYQKLKSEEKKRLQKKLSKAINEFLPAWENWLNHQDKLTLYAKCLLMGPSLPSYLLPEERRPPQRATKNTLLPWDKVFTNIYPSNMSYPKFHNHPTKPPSSAFKVFSLRVDQSVDSNQYHSKADKLKACGEKWKAMDKEERDPFIKHWQQMKDSYREELLSYVGKMDKKMRGVYLGFNRKPLYEYLKEDIFEHQYPNSKYPVYEVSLIKRKNVQPALVEGSEKDNMTNTTPKKHNVGSKVKSTCLKSRAVIEDESDSDILDMLDTHINRFQDFNSSDDEAESRPIKAPHHTSITLPKKMPRAKKLQASANDNDLPFTEMDSSTKDWEGVGSSKRSPTQQDSEYSEAESSKEIWTAKQTAISSLHKFQQQEDSSEADESDEEELKTNKQTAKHSPHKFQLEDMSSEAEESDEKELKTAKPSPHKFQQQEEESSEAEESDDSHPVWQSQSFITSTQKNESWH